jgi:hypothetical protein
MGQANRTGQSKQLAAINRVEQGGGQVFLNCRLPNDYVEWKMLHKSNFQMAVNFQCWSS